MRLMIISNKFILSTILFLIELIIWRILFAAKVYCGLIYAFIVIIAYCLLHRDELLKLKLISKKK